MYLDVSELFGETSHDRLADANRADPTRGIRSALTAKRDAVQDLLSERSVYRLPPSMSAISRLPPETVKTLIAEVLKATEAVPGNAAQDRVFS